MWNDRKHQSGVVEPTPESEAMQVFFCRLAACFVVMMIMYGVSEQLVCAQHTSMMPVPTADELRTVIAKNVDWPMRVNSTTTRIQQSCDEQSEDLLHVVEFELTDGKDYWLYYRCPSWRVRFELKYTRWINAKGCSFHEFDSHNNEQVKYGCSEDVPVSAFNYTGKEDTFEYVLVNPSTNQPVANFAATGEIQFMGNQYFSQLPQKVFEMAGDAFNHSSNPWMDHVHGTLRGDQSGGGAKQFEVFALFPRNYRCVSWWCHASRTMHIHANASEETLEFTPIHHSSLFSLDITLRAPASPPSKTEL